MLSKLFARSAMDLSLQAHDREQAFRELISLLPSLNDGARAGLLLSLLARERLGSTGVGHAIALPHTRYAVPGVSRPQIIFGRLPNGIPYGSPDGAPVRLFFLLVSPDVAQHLQILSRLTRVLRDERLRDELLGAETPEGVLRSIDQAEERLSPQAAPVAVSS
jgi:mannitol/fructose-specific phosphotransferase system IIA component (Ntr-type)